MFSLRLHHPAKVGDHLYYTSMVTMQPQYRSILTTGKTVPQRLYFPYTAFIFQYRKVPHGFMWEGYVVLITFMLISPLENYVHKPLGKLRSYSLRRYSVEKKH